MSNLKELIQKIKQGTMVKEILRTKILQLNLHQTVYLYLLTTDDAIIVSTDDLRNVPRPISADTMMDDSYLSLESYNFADDVVKMSHKVNPISFIDGNHDF